MNDEMELSTDNATEVDNVQLTPARERILEAMINPDFLGLPVSEKCQRINVSRQAWYMALHDEKFMELVQKTSVDLIKDKAADILAASVKVATTSGARGYQDRRMLLEMLGLVVKENDNRIVIVNMGQ